MIERNRCIAVGIVSALVVVGELLFAVGVGTELEMLPSALALAALAVAPLCATAAIVVTTKRSWITTAGIFYSSVVAAGSLALIVRSVVVNDLCGYDCPIWNGVIDITAIVGWFLGWMFFIPSGVATFMVLFLRRRPPPTASPVRMTT